MQLATTTTMAKPQTARYQGNPSSVWAV